MIKKVKIQNQNLKLKKKVYKYFLNNILKVLYIKHGKKITKFKLRGKKYLYTFKTTDKDKATKLL